MFDKLKEIVFGLGEYEKIRIEVRFELIFSMIPSLKVLKIEDFEILEDVISKIKEQLRVKSSNLNKVILDPSKPLKKKDINNLLDDLNKIKYDFLKRAFNLIEKNQTVILDNVIEDSSLKNMNVKEKKTTKKLFFENDKYKVTVENGKVPYVLVVFKEDVDYSVLKNFSDIFYQVYICDGSNIIVDDKRAMIIPRFNLDNLVKLPKINVNLEEVFEKLVHEDKKIDEDKKEEISDDYYVEINSKPKYKSKRANDTLDELLTDSYKKEISVHPNPKEDSSYVEIIEDDKIEIEKKEKVEEKEYEIELNEKKEDAIKDKNIKEIDLTKISKDKIQKNFEVYRDDIIVAYLKEDSKVFGELLVESVNSKKLNELSENDLTYINLFTKAFSSYLFDVTHSHGINIIFDYNSNFIRIIPRYQEDNIDLLWKPILIREDELENIKKRLIEYMMNNNIAGENSSSSSKKENIIVEKPIENKEEFKEQSKLNSEIKVEDDKKKKIEAILESLNRIP